MARMLIYDGLLHCEWILNITEKTVFTGNVIWTDINKVYRVD